MLLLNNQQLTGVNVMRIDTDLNEADRQKIAKELSHLLASTFTLYLKTHYYHWNVTGALFPALHAMFEKQYNELFLAVDVIAERIRALGFPAPGSYAQYKELSWVEDAVGIPKAQQMTHQLLTDHELIIRKIRQTSIAAEKAADEATLDLLTARIDEHEKTAWMLRSSLEDEGV